MRGLAWLAIVLMLPAACGRAATAAPLPTYTGTPEAEGAFYARGTLELRQGCLAMAVGTGDSTDHVMLQLPADAGAEVAWRDGRLWFHHVAYELGSTLLFRATTAEVADLDDVPPVCVDAGLTTAYAAAPGATDLALDPSARVIGGGDQLSVPVAELSNAGMDAAMRSDLAVVGERCLGVDAPGRDDTLLIWPFGTTVLYEPDPVVVLPSGKTYAVGDQLDLGGGYIYEPGQAAPAPIDNLPAECQALSRFLVAPD